VTSFDFPKWATAGVAAITMSVGLTACGGTDPFDIGWTQSPDTVILFSLARPEPNLPSAFDFHLGLAHVLEAPASTGQWDLVLHTQDGRLVFLLPEALGIPSDARIIELPGLTFDEVAEAPSDSTAYTIDDVVTVNLGSVYVVRTHTGSDQFGFNCVFYAKMEALEVDPERGTLLFVYDANPLCGGTDLIAPDQN
jgi:hypothetical protein